MNKFWLFLNSQLISGLIITAVVWLMGNKAESNEQMQFNSFSQETTKLQKQISSLEKDLESYSLQCAENCAASTTIESDLTPAQVVKQWQTVLGTSWAKPGYFIDVNKYASSHKNVVDFDANVEAIENNKATIRVSSSSNNDIKSQSLEPGESMLFNTNGKKFRLTLESIRQAGFWNTLAAYFKVEIETE